MTTPQISFWFAFPFICNKHKKKENLLGTNNRTASKRAILTLQSSITWGGGGGGGANTLTGGTGFLLKGSPDPNKSGLSVVLKKSSDEVPLKGSLSLKGSLPNGSRKRTPPSFTSSNKKSSLEGIQTECKQQLTEPQSLQKKE